MLSLRVNLDAETLDRLGDGSAVVVDDVLPPAVLDDWLARVVRCHAAGELAPAGVGAGRQRDLAIRADHTRFADDGDPLWAEPVAWFDTLGQTLGGELRIALPAFSLQIAAFPPGAGYVRHVDTIRGDPSRRLTATLYLDRSWQPEDGGALRVVEEEEEEGGVERDVAPLGGRMVLFRSDAVAHEVRPARRLRCALTAWFGSEGRIRRR